MIFDRMFLKREKRITLEEIINDKISEGKNYIYEENYSLWSEFVRQSYFGNRFGLEVEAVLIILRELDSDKSILEILNVLDQDPLACEYRKLIIRNKIFLFSKRGPEFLEHILSSDEINDNVRKTIEERKRINLELEKNKRTS